MQKTQRKLTHCKIFSSNPAELQEIIDTLRDTFKGIIISQIQRSTEGDYFCFVTWTEAPQ